MGEDGNTSTDPPLLQTPLSLHRPLTPVPSKPLTATASANTASLFHLRTVTAYPNHCHPLPGSLLAASQYGGTRCAEAFSATRETCQSPQTGHDSAKA